MSVSNTVHESLMFFSLILLMQDLLILPESDVIFGFAFH